MKPEIAIIVSIYNKIDVLKLVLSSLEFQSFNNFEVIISDDGSNQDSVRQIKNLVDKYTFPVKHVWHPDTGWNKNAILNKSIIAAKAPYIIFIDGDCLLHYKFVEEHFLNKSLNTMLTGRRVNLSKRITLKLTADLINNGYLKNKIVADCFWDSIKSEARDVEQGVYIKISFIKNYLNRKEKGVLGSNFSLSKQDLLEINGFDERFTHPAIGEDTDIEDRLRRNGLKVKSIRNQAIQYHLYHKQLPRDKARFVFFDENTANNVTYTPFGIVKN